KMKKDKAQPKKDKASKTSVSKSKKNEADKSKGKAKKPSIEELKEQVLSEKDRALRLSAEFDNYKKRKQREIDEFKKFANANVFKQLLGAVDNLERAIESTENDPDESNLLEGVKLTHKEILKLFETFNVKLVEAEQKPFDPNFHQAVTQEETDEYPDNTVTNVLQKGYMLHDRLIRPAMVVVSKRVEKVKENTKEK
ncbi:MAG: nucleotide exchange factor GrpE, partial [Desulfobacteraceae bacterium]|nr:nucleotide exchange factor GrpE [Desulfobacteraceae bacterium]